MEHDVGIQYCGRIGYVLVMNYKCNYFNSLDQSFHFQSFTISTIYVFSSVTHINV